MEVVKVEDRQWDGRHMDIDKGMLIFLFVKYYTISVLSHDPEERNLPPEFNQNFLPWQKNII